MSESIRDLCTAPAGKIEILQGNIAFAVGCVRAGIHAADGYPGTPSSEVIDKGLAQVQDLITVGWSVNEAVAAGVGHGHSIAGRDCVVTMKIPGLFQAADIFSSGALFQQERGALIYYIASDFVPNSTQHTIDPHYFLRSCFVPIIEPRNHQELHEAAALAVELGRKFHTPVVIMPGGNLCHTEGMVRLMPIQKRDPVRMPENLRSFNVLPGIARKNYDSVMIERMPALELLVETSSLNTWKRGAGTIGIVTYGITDLYIKEIEAEFELDLDVFSIGITNPLPMNRIREFCESINGPIYVFEDGYRYLQEALQAEGIRVIGKPSYSNITEWTPTKIAEVLGLGVAPVAILPEVVPVNRPPVICAGCPYRLFAQEVALLKKKKMLDVVFGDIGCNTLLYFMNALDTGLAMGASEAERIGYVLSKPQQAGRVISVVGDGTECHSGMDATRNTVYRNVPGVKVILDNSWTGMTGGQPSPTSPTNLAGESIKFNLADSLAAHGAKVIEVGAYNKKDIRAKLKLALTDASSGEFTTIIVNDGVCIQKQSSTPVRVKADSDVCTRCDVCLICPGITPGLNGVPSSNMLCSGCGGHEPACIQMCPIGALEVTRTPADIKLTIKDQSISPVENFSRSHEELVLPESLRLAIRGVGGQGNLFFGSVLSQLALLAGYGETNILKGETHGMAQMGGPVISTFACGLVHSPLLLPKTADCLIVMERSEVLRPGFIQMLKQDGTILMASTRIVPFGLKSMNYPSDEQLMNALVSFKVVEIDVLKIANELGDLSGRSANVVMLGVLSTLSPFDCFPQNMWLSALYKANSRPGVWSVNSAAFSAGRDVGLASFAPAPECIGL